MTDRISVTRWIATHSVSSIPVVIMALALVFVTVAPREASAAAPAAKGAAGWNPPGCPPPRPSAKGKSHLKVSGPCATDVTVDAECENDIDDLTFTARIPAKDGAEMIVYINVERFAGAGTYKGPNDFYVSVMKAPKIWRWSGNDFGAVVEPGARSVTIKNVRLEPELLLIGCSGDQANYQCDGRGDDPRHMASVTTISGTLYCKNNGEVEKK